MNTKLLAKASVNLSTHRFAEMRASTPVPTTVSVNTDNVTSFLSGVMMTLFVLCKRDLRDSSVVSRWYVPTWFLIFPANSHCHDTTLLVRNVNETHLSAFVLTISLVLVEIVHVPRKSVSVAACAGVISNPNRRVAATR